jgi:hypothetical protein
MNNLWVNQALFLNRQDFHDYKKYYDQCFKNLSTVESLVDQVLQCQNAMLGRPLFSISKDPSLGLFHVKWVGLKALFFIWKVKNVQPPITYIKIKGKDMGCTNMFENQIQLVNFQS